MSGKLYVVPILNMMGPVTDPRHSDLLNTWDEVHAALEAYFTDDFRFSFPDSHGNPVAVSWFPVNWTGFTENPVQRDFGWFTIYDQLVGTWGEKLRRYGDGIHWMYNHPDKSGVGNAWGLDWLENATYLDILNHLIMERNFLPGVIEVPTCDTHTAHFVENFFPFSLCNRNSLAINWDNIEADGRRTRDVLQWADAPKDWSFYHPRDENHQLPGSMRHLIFRLLDIKTRIMDFPDDEVTAALERCRAGHDVIIAGYEHDFRDRSQVVRECFLDKIRQIRERSYPEIEVIHTSMHDACRRALGSTDVVRPLFTVRAARDYVRISSSSPLFNITPYVVIRPVATGAVYHQNPTPVGRNEWGIQRCALPDHFEIAVAGFGDNGLQNITRFIVDAGKVSEAPLPRITIPFN